jgi:hypothetical protein
MVIPGARGLRNDVRMDRSGSPPEDLFAAARKARANGRRLQAHGLLEACVESGHVGWQEAPRRTPASGPPAHKTAVKTATLLPTDAVGPLQGARACWQLTPVERPDGTPALLDETSQWLLTPGRGPQAAAQIIEDLEAWEGHLAPRPAEALAWARTI